MLGAIRLAWWREALERLDRSPPPPEPRLQAAASELMPRGISGKELAALEDGWATLLDEIPDTDRIANRGAIMFRLAAKLLGGSDGNLEKAGGLFARTQVTRRGLMVPQGPPEEMQSLSGCRFPRGLRPLTAFARLAARDTKQAPLIEPEATPGRAAALLSHRLFGTIG